MCGIAGFIDFTKASSQEVLVNMTNSLNHRGPDGSGYEFIQTPTSSIGLGHRRLKIVDLSETGSQPMKFEHWLITFNGEIYNYKEIKVELETLGHHFIGHSDTEVILHAFAQWGIACIEKFMVMKSTIGL